MKLGSLIRVRTGKIDANAAVKNGLYPFFTCSKEISKINKYEFDCECVLIAGNGDLNIKYYNGKFNAYQRTYIIESIDKNKLSVKFLYYFFLWYIEVLRYKSIGGVIKYIKIKDITDVNLVLPAIDEQKELVEFFDKISVLINKKQNEFQQLNELIKSRFIEMFIDKGYPIYQLKSLAIAKAEYGASSASIPYEKNRPRYVRITDINDDGSLNDDIVCSKNQQDDIDYKLSYGDFLFARMGATVGKTYAFFEGNEIYAGYLIRYKLNTNKINPNYLFFYTKTEQYWLWVQNNQNGAAQPGINAKKYDVLKIPLAPITTQNRFANFVKLVDKLKFVCYSKYFLCDILTFESSTIAYSSVVSIFACPNIF